VLVVKNKDKDWDPKLFKFNTYNKGREVLDHYVLVIKNKDRDWDPKLFKFFDIWQQEDEFKEILYKYKYWEGNIDSGNISIEKEILVVEISWKP